LTSHFLGHANCNNNRAALNWTHRPEWGDGKLTDKDQSARNWAMGCHLAALTLYVGIPFGNLLGPLLVWLFKKDEYALVDEQGKESLNFQISLLVYSIVAIIAAIACAVTVIMIPVAILLGILLAVLFVVNLVMIIVAAVKTSNGERFTYPLSIKFIK
jgi:uncharacterized Tic20 family protein